MQNKIKICVLEYVTRYTEYCFYKAGASKCSFMGHKWIGVIGDT